MNYKITMIGRSGSGKSAYMSGLFEKLFDNRSYGYSIMPCDDRSSQHGLALAGAISEYTFSELGNIFPPGTTDTTLYKFEVHQKGNFVCNFEWIDYRGKLVDRLISKDQLEETSGDRLDIQNLLSHVNNSNAIAIFVDGIKLSSIDSDQNRKKVVGGRIINLLLKRISIDSPSKNLSIALIITKADSDLIPQEHKNHDYTILRERCLKAFSEVKHLCNDNATRWFSKIAVVGAVGEGLVKSQRQNGAIITQIIGEPNPLNVEYPLLFLLKASIDKTLDSIRTNIEDLKSSRNIFKSNKHKLYKLTQEYNNLLEHRNSLLDIYSNKLNDI